MVGADESTELLQHPYLHFAVKSYFHVGQVDRVINKSVPYKVCLLFFGAKCETCHLLQRKTSDVSYSAKQLNK